MAKCKFLSYNQNINGGERRVMDHTFRDSYIEWIDSLKKTNLKEVTILRHEQRYKKYIEKSNWIDMNLGELRLSNLEDWANSLIKDFPGLTAQEWGNIRSILRGVIHLALVKGYVSENLVERIRLTSRTLSKKKSNARKKVFLLDEEFIILEECKQDFKNTGSYVPLAIQFNLFMGLRVGELLALKWSDINCNKIHIQRQYEKSIDSEGNYCYKVVEYTKTARSGLEDSSDRVIPIPEKAWDVLNTIKEVSKSEYIFYQNNKLITTSMLNHRLYKYQNKRGITPLKSSHALRRTYASKLNDYGFNVKTIQSLLGHRNVETTYEYIFDLEEKDSLLSKLNNTFDS